MHCAGYIHGMLVFCIERWWFSLSLSRSLAMVAAAQPLRLGNVFSTNHYCYHDYLYIDNLWCMCIRYTCVCFSFAFALLMFLLLSASPVFFFCERLKWAIFHLCAFCTWFILPKILFIRYFIQFMASVWMVFTWKHWSWNQKRSKTVPTEGGRFHYYKKIDKKWEKERKKHLGQN